jgi:hypothetical protein
MPVILPDAGRWRGQQVLGDYAITGESRAVSSVM